MAQGALGAPVVDVVEDGHGRPVQVKEGADSHRAAARLGAHAFTFREEVFLGAGLGGAGQPHTDEVLAHEVAHVEQMRNGSPVAAADEAEAAAEDGAGGEVGADPDTPYGLWWLIPVAAGAYVLLRPNVANAPSPEDVEQGRTRESVSELQVAGEALALFALPTGYTSLLARAGYGVVTSMALGGAASSVGFRGVQDVGAGEFSGVEAYLIDAATGATIGAIVGGGVRLLKGPQALGQAQGPDELIHWTRPDAAAKITQVEGGQIVGQLEGRTGIWALSRSSLDQSPWLRAVRATKGDMAMAATSDVRISAEAATAFSRPAPVGPMSLYQYVAGVYRAPAGAISAGGTGQFTARGTILNNLYGQIIPYGADAGIYIAAGTAAAAVGPSSTADERGIRSLVASLPPTLQPLAENYQGDVQTSRSDGPFVALPGLVSPSAAVAAAQGSYDPVEQVCYSADATESEMSDGPGSPPAMIFVAPFWPEAGQAGATEPSGEPATSGG